MRSLTDLSKAYETAARHCENVAAHIVDEAAGHAAQISYQQHQQMDALLKRADSLRTSAARVLRVAVDSPASDSNGHSPRFQENEAVVFMGIDSVRRPGTILKTYPFGGGWRYVVRGDDGKEQVVFESEVVRDNRFARR